MQSQNYIKQEPIGSLEDSLLDYSKVDIVAPSSSKSVKMRCYQQGWHG